MIHTKRHLLRRSLAGLAVTALAAGLSLVATPAAAAPGDRTQPSAHTSATAEPQVWNELTGNGTTDFWVELRERADLSGAASIADWAGRGQLVYDRLRQTAETSQAGLRELLETADASYQPYWIANTVRVTGDAELLEQILLLPEVAEVTADRVYQIPEPVTATPQEKVDTVEWGIDRINAPQVWSDFGVRGEGIVVGSIDSGVLYTHPALVDQYRGNQGNGGFDHNYNWWDPSNICGNPSLEPCDNNGHGTHTMGTAVGDDGGDNQIGVAPGATWMTAKGCESSNCSRPALLSAGQFMVAPTDLEGNNPDPAMRPHVLNNSWGGGANTDPWYQQTVQAWVSAGIFPQWSNGNSGALGCTTAGNPGNLMESYSAGSFDINGNIAGTSSRGPSPWDTELIKPNIAAPGVAVRSSWNDGDYNAISGTSMASPHVAGTVALMWSAANALVRDIDATRALLDTTAIDTADDQCGGTPENNNVWGQGKLDAFAAVEQSPRGQVGTLAGAVTDSTTGDPIADATITITGEVDREVATGESGTYSITLPVGDYHVEASAFGYVGQTAQVSIVVGQTTTRDFPLVAEPRVSISGLIRDGSGHGWPMYAKVTVEEAPDTAVFTDPFNGRYRVSVPANASYTLTVESQFPGYPDVTETVEVGAGNVVRDLLMTVDVLQCREAAGYQLDQPRMAMLSSNPGSSFSDYFDERGIEVDFFTASQIDQITGYDVVMLAYNPSTVNDQAFLDFLDRTDTEGTGVMFLDHAFTTHNGIRTLSRVTGNPEVADSTSGGGVGAETYYQPTQAHPILEGFDIGEQIIVEPGLSAWIAWFEGYTGEGTQVIADVGRTNEGILGSGIGVQERATNRHALLSMNSQTAGRGPDGWSEDSDEIFWNAVEWVAPGEATFECNPVDGGLVAGHVRDRNTGDGINGATVTSVDNPDASTTTFATPEDAARDDGFYWMFSSLTGRHRFTASAGNYQDLTRPAVVEADWTTRRNFRLAAGQLAIAPGGVQAEVPLGGSAQRTFTVTNTGTAPAELELSERDGGFEILRADGTRVSGPEILASPGAPLQRVDAAVSDLSATASGAVTGSTPQAVPGDEPWQDIASYPFPIMDNLVGEWDGQVYSVTGIDNASNWHEETMRFDPTTGSWTELAPIPTPREKPNGAIIDGRFYVVGGWDPLGATVPTLEIYDIASDSWSTGAPIPVARSASASAVLDGKLYLVGGCQASCGASDVWVYDPAADSWSQAASYPQLSSWTHCGPIDGLLYCAGSSQGAQDTGYVYDPASDSWDSIASLPTTVWGGSYVAANGLLLVSGGVVGGSITNQGFAYDPASDSWAPLPNSNNALYRGGSACGFYRIGGAVSNFNAVPDSELLPGFENCGAVADVPWLAADPATATLQPGDSVQVTVSLAADVAQPGAFTASIPMRENTPYSVAPVEVTMNVTPPTSWGKLTGTVLGTSCDGETAPLTDATVQLSTWVMELTLFTDGDGGYARWLDFRHSPFFVIVAKDGYQPQFRQVSVAAGEITVADWTLRAVCASGSERADQHLR